MAYDKNLDKAVYEQPVIVDKSILTVAIYSYNDGPKKLQISRAVLDDNNKEKFAKLGRMTKEEFEKVFPLLEEARKHMD